MQADYRVTVSSSWGNAETGDVTQRVQTRGYVDGTGATPEACKDDARARVAAPKRGDVHPFRGTCLRVSVRLSVRGSHL